MIPKEEVQRIAKLARIELTEQEIEKMQKELSAVFDYFTVLKEARISRVRKIMKGKNKAENATRQDQVLPQNANLAGDLISAAPSRGDNYIKVKKVL